MATKEISQQNSQDKTINSTYYQLISNELPSDKIQKLKSINTTNRGYKKNNLSQEINKSTNGVNVLMCKTVLQDQESIKNKNLNSLIFSKQEPNFKDLFQVEKQRLHKTQTQFKNGFTKLSKMKSFDNYYHKLIDNRNNQQEWIELFPSEETTKDSSTQIQQNNKNKKIIQQKKFKVCKNQEIQEQKPIKSKCKNLLSQTSKNTEKIILNNINPVIIPSKTSKFQFTPQFYVPLNTEQLKQSILKSQSNNIDKVEGQIRQFKQLDEILSKLSKQLS